ncbi:MAG: hypothetical protein Q9167_004094 [Letrouitia subvulpina]
MTRGSRQSKCQYCFYSRDSRPFQNRILELNHTRFESIIAVHGLAANPYWTWVAVPEGQKTKHWRWLLQISRSSAPTSTTNIATPDSPAWETRVNWLEKFLPDIVPNTRIMTFGYQSNYMRSAPKQSISNCAQELLNALIEARPSEKALIKSTLASKRYGSIRTATQGIIFLGTPHRGVSIASYGDMLVSITKAAGLGSDTSLVHSLREQSAQLLKLASNFSDVYDAFDIFCFYELLPWRFGYVVVNQQSAVIEGRPSEGLNTDHSGLNKYGSKEDYSFRRIAREMKRMVGLVPLRAQGRVNSEAGTTNSEVLNKSRPWVDAATLVVRADEAFEQALSTANTSDRAQSVDVLRCRFRAWTYSAGLSKVNQSARPLHGLLDTFVAPKVCEYLQQILQNLSEISDSKDGRQPEAQYRQMNNLINELYSIFPEEDKTASDQIFSATLLRSDDTNTLENIRSNATVQEFPDIELVAAMKRINILQENAEATRKDDEKLSISMKDIILDKTIFSRSTGTYTPISDGIANHMKQIIVEWKEYQGYWDTEIGNQLFNRAELLAYFLHKASEGSTVLELRVLDCLGYCHDEERKRLGFVFAIPASAGNSRSYTTLHSQIAQNLKKPALLGDRFRLAQTLCKAMFGFHQARWFHKSFSSHNVIFFSDIDAAVVEDESSSPPPASSSALNYPLTTPYIVGFNNSRPDRPTEFSEPAHPSLDMLRYRHWEYKNRPMQKYKREYDYYSLENTEWCQLDAKAFAEKVRTKCCPRLGSFAGAMYQNVVAELLDGGLHEKSLEEGGLEDEAGLEVIRTIEYQTSILERLSRCSA